jgi:heat shock protein HtpX
VDTLASVNPQQTRPRTGLNYVKTTLLLGALTALLVFLGGRLGGQTGLVIGFSFALLMNVGSYWWSDKIVLAMHHAKEADRREVPWLFEIVEGLARRAGLPMPRIYIVDEDAPNAFATGRNPRHAVVAVTTGLLRILDKKEIEGVLAHELGHVRNRDILIMSVAATLAGAVQMIGTMLHWGAILGLGGGRRDSRGGGGLELLVWAIVAPLIAVIVQLWISRTREYAADAEGARLCGSARGLASALRRLESANRRIPSPARPATAHLYIVAPLSGGVGKVFATHPPIEERIQRLESMNF